MIDPYPYFKAMSVIGLFGLLMATISPFAHKHRRIEEWFLRVAAFCMVLAAFCMVLVFVLFVLFVVNL